MTSYQAIIVGAGQGGSPLALELARSGWRVALIERGEVGGTCINTGCTPTKTLIASARAAHLARRSESYGVETGSVRVDMARVRARKDGVVQSFRAGSLRRLEQQENLDLLRGQARFVGPRTLAVTRAPGDTLELRGDVIVLDVGQRPRIPELAGLEEVDYLSSSSILDLAEVPEHLLILGGGYIGLEFAQMFRRFGSEVTLVQRGPQLLSREDEDVAKALGVILEEEGVRVHLNAEARQVQRASGGLRLRLETDTGTREVQGSHLLVATGRQPNTEALALERAGIARDSEGYIPVNDRFQTSAEDVYAIGDVTGGPAFTHISYDDYRIVRNQLLGDGSASKRGRLVPYVVFTDPQLGRVGLSERQARERGLEYRLARLEMSSVARATEVGETRGFMKVLVAEDERLLGASVLGVEGGELMSALQLAMLGRLPYTALRDGCFAHPTLAESFNTLFAELEA